jgi:hypothetical protein
MKKMFWKEEDLHEDSAKVDLEMELVSEHRLQEILFAHGHAPGDDHKVGHRECLGEFLGDLFLPPNFA